MKKSVLFVLITILFLYGFAPTYQVESTDPNPITFSQEEESTKQTEEIEEAETPLSTVRTSWSIVNLVLMCISILCCIILFCMLISERGTGKPGGKLWVFFGIIVGMLSIFLYILTQDMSLQMDYLDRYTIWMAIMLCFQGITILYLTAHPQSSKK